MFHGGSPLKTPCLRSMHPTPFLSEGATRKGCAKVLPKKTPPSRGLWRSCGSYASGTAMELLDRVVEAAVARVLILLLRTLTQCLVIGFLALHRHLLRLAVWLGRMVRRLGRLRARHLPAFLVQSLWLSVRLPRHLVGRFRRALGGLRRILIGGRIRRIAAARHGVRTRRLCLCGLRRALVSGRIRRIGAARGSGRARRLRL